MSKVPPGRRCESDEGPSDGLGHGAGVGEPSDNADEIPSEWTVMIILLARVSRGKRVDLRFCRE